MKILIKWTLKNHVLSCQGSRHFQRTRAFKYDSYWSRTCFAPNRFRAFEIDSGSLGISASKLCGAILIGWLGCRQIGVYLWRDYRASGTTAETQKTVYRGCVIPRIVWLTTRTSWTPINEWMHFYCHGQRVTKKVLYLVWHTMGRPSHRWPTRECGVVTSHRIRLWRWKVHGIIERFRYVGPRSGRVPLSRLRLSVTYRWSCSFAKPDGIDGTTYAYRG